jgi:hypothetical protein
MVLKGAWLFGNGRVISADDVVGCAVWVGHVGVDPACHGAHRARLEAQGVKTDDTASCAVLFLLIGDVHSCFF